MREPAVCHFGTQVLSASLDVYWLRFGSFSRPPTPVLKDHGFVTVNGMICNKEFVFVAKNLLLLLWR